MGTKRIEHVVEDGVEKKHCVTCKTFKPLDDFSRCKQTWDELSCACRACHSIAEKMKRRGPDLKEEEDYGRVPHVTENGVEKKRCGTCKEYKALDVFSRYSRSWDGLRPKCNPCVKQAYIDRKDQALAQMKVHYEENKERRLAYHKEWRAKNPEYNKDKNRRDKEWRQDNPELHKEKIRKRKEQGGEKYILQSLKRGLQSRLWYELKKKSALKTGSTMNIVGCDIEKFKIHLESLFIDGMTWKNYGAPHTHAQTWECDHIQPCASFNLANPVHLKACFHYKNYRPLWAKDNRLKSSKYDADEWKIYMKRFVETYIM